MGRERSKWGKDIFEKIGVAFDSPNLYEKLTAYENLDLLGSYYHNNGVNKDELLDRVGLLPDRDKRVEKYSKGMKMRLNFIRSIEYLLAKMISLTLVALIAGIMITIAAYQQSIFWPVLIVGIILTSSFFVLYGFIAAADCTTMNQYFIKMIPYMLVIILPCFSLIGFPYSWVFNVFPSVAGLQLVLGAYNEITLLKTLGFSAYLLAANILMLFYVVKVFDRMVTKGE